MILNCMNKLCDLVGSSDSKWNEMKSSKDFKYELTNPLWEWVLGYDATAKHTAVWVSQSYYISSISTQSEENNYPYLHDHHGFKHTFLLQLFMPFFIRYDIMSYENINTKWEYK